MNNLLGREDATALGLVKRLEEVSGAFGEHGTLKTEPVKTRLKEGAEPYAVTTACRVPLPIILKVKEEPSRMKSLGAIESHQQTGAVHWCL